MRVNVIWAKLKPAVSLTNVMWGRFQGCCRGISICFCSAFWMLCLLCFPPSLPQYSLHTSVLYWQVPEGGMRLGCHGDLLANRRLLLSSVATFTAPTLQCFNLLSQVGHEHVYSRSSVLLSIPRQSLLLLLSALARCLDSFIPKR